MGALAQVYPSAYLEQIFGLCMSMWWFLLSFRSQPNCPLLLEFFPDHFRPFLTPSCNFTSKRQYASLETQDSIQVTQLLIINPIPSSYKKPHHFQCACSLLQSYESSWPKASSSFMNAFPYSLSPSLEYNLQPVWTYHNVHCCLLVPKRAPNT